MCARLSPWSPEPAWAWVAVAVLRAVRGRRLRLHPHTHSTRACAHGHTRAHTDTTTHATCTCTHVRAHGHTSTHVRTCACAHTDTQAHTGTCPHTRAHFLAAPRAMCCHTLTQPRSHSLTHLNAPVHRDTLAHTHARSHQTPWEQLPGPSPAAPGPGGWQAPSCLHIPGGGAWQGKATSLSRGGSLGSSAGCLTLCLGRCPRTGSRLHPSGVPSQGCQTHSPPHRAGPGEGAVTAGGDGCPSGAMTMF